MSDSKRGRKPLPDTERRISHHFRFKPDVKSMIEDKSFSLEMNKTEYVESLVLKDNEKQETK